MSTEYCLRKSVDSSSKLSIEFRSNLENHSKAGPLRCSTNSKHRPASFSPGLNLARATDITNDLI
ncbi:unnamed protein product [Arabidopsis halleri]